MNLTNTCRTCLKNNKDEPVEITTSIYEFLEDLNIQRIPRVHPQLKLPQSICFDCYRNLIAFKRFFAQCRDAEEFFKIKLEKLQHESLQAAEIDNDDIEEDDKIYRLTKESNYDLLDLIENCEEDEEEIPNNTYVDENTSILCSDVAIADSEFQSNVDSNIKLETIELEYKDNVYGNEENEYLDDEQNSIMIVQYEECSESEYGNKGDGALLVLDEKTSNQIESIDHNQNENLKNRKRRFQCHSCEKSFSSRYDLQMHENIHYGIKPFKCNICGKCFRQKNILRTHETLHFGKTIKCEECGKTFARKSQLILHDRMHRNEKPFVCDYDDSCGAAFRERQHLLAHQKIHSGLRAFQCHICSRAFYHRKGLLGHIRDLHGNTFYQCNLCERSFNKPYKIRRHMQAVHDLQLTDVSQFKINTCTEELSEDVDDVEILYEED